METGSGGQMRSYNGRSGARNGQTANLEQTRMSGYLSFISSPSAPPPAPFG